MAVVRKTLFTCGKDGLLKAWKIGYHLDSITSVTLPDGTGFVKSVLYREGITLNRLIYNTCLLFTLNLSLFEFEGLYSFVILRILFQLLLCSLCFEGTLYLGSKSNTMMSFDAPFDFMGHVKDITFNIQPHAQVCV